MTCPSGAVPCAGSGECIPRSYLCDKDPDCADGSDESPVICGEFYYCITRVEDLVRVFQDFVKNYLATIFYHWS